MIFQKLVCAIITCCVCAGTAVAQEIPFRLVHNMILLPVEVNGVKTIGRLDTGGTSSVMHPAFAKELGLTISEKTIAAGVSTEWRQYGTVSPVNLKLGERVVRTDRVMIVALSTMAPDARDRIGITLGRDVMRDFVVSIDFDRSVVEFTPSNTFVAPSNSNPIKLGQTHGERWIRGSITGWKSVLIGFDTGDPGAVSFGDYVARAALRGRPSSQSVIRGVDGLQTVLLSTLPSLVIAGVTFENVPVSIRPARDERIGIGLDILKRFNIVLDSRHDRIWMTKNAGAGQPFRRDRVGIETQGDGWAGKPEKIVFVSPGSPAERAGFRVGEIVLQVLNDSGARVDNLRETADGQRVTFTMSDGSRRELVTQAYY